MIENIIWTSTTDVDGQTLKTFLTPEKNIKLLLIEKDGTEKELVLTKGVVSFLARYLVNNIIREYQSDYLKVK